MEPGGEGMMALKSAFPTQMPVDLASASRKLEATASSWRMCPKLNDRRNDPCVDGAVNRLEFLQVRGERSQSPWTTKRWGS